MFEISYGLHMKAFALRQFNIWKKSVVIAFGYGINALEIFFLPETSARIAVMNDCHSLSRTQTEHYESCAVGSVGVETEQPSRMNSRS